MKYLKLYESFRITYETVTSGVLKIDSPAQLDEKDQTIREICLELEDYGADILIRSTYKTQKSVSPWYRVVVVMGLQEIPWEAIRECALRIKDYLGDDYTKFSYLETDHPFVIGKPSKPGKRWKDVDLNDKTKLGRIRSISIDYK